MLRKLTLFLLFTMASLGLLGESLFHYDPFYLKPHCDLGSDLCTLVFDETKIVFHYGDSNHEETWELIEQARIKKVLVQVDRSKLIKSLRYVGPLHSPIAIKTDNCLCSCDSAQTIKLSLKPISFDFVTIFSNNFTFVRESYLPFDNTCKYEISLNGKKKVVWLTKNMAEHLERLRKGSVIAVNKTAFDDPERYFRFLIKPEDLIKTGVLSINGEGSVSFDN